jgi:hypothetical protein
MHLKPTAGCQISTLIFGFGGKTLCISHEKIPKDGSSLPLGVEVKGIARAFNRLKCQCGIMHLKPTAGCQISTLIFEIGGGEPVDIP